MEPQDSQSCSQKPATGPYHDTDEFSPQHQTLFS
jgi:hypothetical protein